MLRFLIILILAGMPLLAHAWNAAGHRLAAGIAWQQLSPASRQLVAEALTRHPDHAYWLEKSGTGEAQLIFAEASSWADSIRHDPRYYDENTEPPTPPIPGLFDNARHKRWHYVDFDDAGRRQDGEIDLQIERLSQLLRSSDDREQVAWIIPWLLHLVADIHQPLHVGKDGDAGGNKVGIETPGKRQPFSNLHQYWDELPGPSSLRGKRLLKAVDNLLAQNKAPVQASVRQWRDESHRLLAKAYPPENGSLLPIVDEEFQQQSQAIADRRIVEAGYRLGRLLENIFAVRVSRETP